MNTKAIFSLVLLPAIIVAADEPKEIPLWPNGAPGSEGKNDKEIVQRGANGERSVYSIHNPSVTPYLPPKDRTTGAAVIVIPGGGHRVLAIDHEGYNVAQWLSERGLAAFVPRARDEFDLPGGGPCAGGHATRHPVGAEPGAGMGH